MLSDFFRIKFGQQSVFTIDYTPDNIADADVIIVSLCNGARYTCFPELRARRKGIIIGLVDEIDSGRRSPSCFADIIYIMRSESPAEFTTKIVAAWQKWLTKSPFSEHKSCNGCKHRTLSFRQEEIIAGLYQGYSVKDIAFNMSVSHKTVFTHKYQVMRKFGLKNDYDLFRFLSMLHAKNDTRLFF